MPQKMQFPATYDPDEVRVLINGLEVYGFAEGSMVTVERNQDYFNNYTGTRGEVSRAVVRDDSGIITFRLQHTSPFIETIRNLITVDAIAGVPPVIAITIQDPSSYEQVVASFCWINNDGTMEWGNEITEREYQFFATNVTAGPYQGVNALQQFIT